MSVSLAGVPMEEIYAEHRNSIRRYIDRHVIDLHVVDDLVQDTFLRAIAQADKFDLDADKILPWLTGHAACAVGDYVWSQRRYLRTARTVHREREPASPVRRDLTDGRLAEALARLPEVQRRTIQHRVLDGLSLNTTAELMGVRQNAVVVRQRRALAALRESVGGIR